MVEPGSITINVLLAKLVSILSNIASIAGFALYIADRTSHLPLKSGVSGLNVVLHLAVLTAVCFGILWTAAEFAFGWHYGAGGSGILPVGWSAVTLSLSMTLPLAFVPALYQVVTGVIVLPPLHWRAIFLVVLGGACAYLLMFGTSSKVPNGLRHRLIPDEKSTPFARGLVQEALFTTFIIGLIVLPYRIVVNPNEPLPELIFGRFVLPWLVYFTGMAIFIALKYPGSLRDSTWIQVRGIVAGLLVMFSLCGGMFF